MRNLAGPPRHFTVKPSLLAMVADYLSDPRFFIGGVVGAGFTVGAAFVWSFYL